MSENQGVNLIGVVAKITAKSDEIERVKSVLLSLVKPTHQESGCIYYQLFQDQTNKNEFTFMEHWKSNHDLDLHKQTSHFVEGFSQLEPLIAKPITVSVMDPISS